MSIIREYKQTREYEGVEAFVGYWNDSGWLGRIDAIRKLLSVPGVILHELSHAVVALFFGVFRSMTVTFKYIRATERGEENFFALAGRVTTEKREFMSGELYTLMALIIKLAPLAVAAFVIWLSYTIPVTMVFTVILSHPAAYFPGRSDILGAIQCLRVLIMKRRIRKFKRK